MKKTWKILLGTLAIVITAGVSLLIWAILIEPARIKFNEYPVYLTNWPDELSGFTIAFITDTHVGSPHITLQKLQDIVTLTNNLKPDLILLGGDYVIQGVLGGHPVPSQDIVTVLAKLKARHGVYGVLGNHDWWENAPRIRQEFETASIPMLEDVATHLSIGSKGVWLVGVSDYTEGPHSIAKAFANVSGTDPVLTLAHSPDTFPELPAQAVLTLSGHTHGGQIALPFYGPLVVPSKYGTRYAKGLMEEQGRQLFVSTGIGTSILPIRFLTPPEVAILKVYPAR